MNGGYVLIFLEKCVWYLVFDYIEMCLKCMYLKYILDICGFIKKCLGLFEIIK